MTPLFLAIPVIFLCVCSATLAVYWSIAAYRITRTFAALPTARDGVVLTSEQRPLCVIVPAHNEAQNITPLIESLKTQTHPEFHVVLALDRCTDNTESVAREAIDSDPRFEIVTITQCPDDWAGKVHAAHTGYLRSEHAQSACHLLFTDADCTFDPKALQATAALLEHRNLDMLSLFSSLTSKAWFERIVQPAAGLELGRWFPLNRANADTGPPKRPFANGQFMLFRGETYRQLNGHASHEVRAALLEDIALARRFANQGKATGLLFADGMVRCQMYDSWAAFRQGWKRIFTESANRKPDRLASAATRLRLMNLMPILAVACFALAWAVPWDDQPLASLALGLPVLGLIAWFYSLARVQRSTHAPLWAALLWPIGGWFVAGILAEAAKDLRKGTPTHWGGRSYARDAR